MIDNSLTYLRHTQISFFQLLVTKHHLCARRSSSHHHSSSLIQKINISNNLTRKLYSLVSWRPTARNELQSVGDLGAAEAPLYSPEVLLLGPRDVGPRLPGSALCLTQLARGTQRLPDHGGWLLDVEVGENAHLYYLYCSQVTLRTSQSELSGFINFGTHFDKFRR